MIKNHTINYLFDIFWLLLYNKQIKKQYFKKEILQIKLWGSLSMKIAVFDDDLCDSTVLKHLLYIFSNFKKISLVVDVFTNENALFKEKQNYILFFISFKTQNGIRLAQKLYNSESKIPMIITAPDCGLAMQAFKINAYNFLQTPLNQDRLFEILEGFFDTYLSGPLLISDGFETICINTDDIFYLEADNKHCLVHLETKTVHCNKTMARVYNVLPEDRFLKISRAFIVNSNHVSRFSSEYVTLINGATLHPSRNFYKTFKCDYFRTQTPKIP